MVRFRIGLFVLAATAAALASALPALAQSTAVKATAVKATAVTVTAGKPSEFGFTLSKKTVPAGPVTFTVTNKGLLPHDFKVCSAPSTTLANACAGKVTTQILAGKTAKLTVTFAKAGKFEYLCTVSGHAAAGMKGLLTVTGAAGAKPAPAKTTAVKVTAGKPSEFGFTLSKKTVPHGSVTFTVTNRGLLPHDFKVCSAPSTKLANACAGKVTTQILAGKTAKLTVTLAKAGKFEYLCTVSGHAAAGMKGTLTVT